MSVYNSEKYIKETLHSILNQTINDISVIIVDDGSTDGTQEIIESIAKCDERVIYRYQENAGIVAAVSAAMQLCTASFVARHDGDDISYPDRFEKQLSYLEANKDCVAVSALARHIDQSGEPVGTETRVKDMSQVDDSSIPANEPYVLQPFLMMRLSSYEAAGGYRNLTIGEDTDLYWRMMNLGRLHILPEILGDYRIHQQSISSNSILSGRRMSAWTQLSALSAQRVRRNAPDLEFTQDLQRRIDSQYELIDLFNVASADLDEEERSWFYSAIAAKLIEVCYYRPFEPSKSDIKFIRRAPKFDRHLKSRVFYDVYTLGLLSAGIRMMIDGNVNHAFSIVPILSWHKLVARSLFRKLVPTTVRGKIKKLRKYR
jgi:glycosyltransferase involved in cell wall biosynthesis